MAADIPRIDTRTYADLVAHVADCAQQLTGGAIAPPAGGTTPTADSLVGAVLDQTIADPQGGAPLGVPGRVVDEAAAERIAALPNLGSVRVRGWQGLQALPGTADALTGAVLGQSLSFPSAIPPLKIDAGTPIDAALAQRIAQLGLAWVAVLPPPDPTGSALIGVFSRMAELAIDRLNQLPDRNFLAFLDLIGTQLAPPQPARVPITFQLVAGGTVDTLVPAGTQVVATPLPGETDPVLFATERDLVVTRSQLAAAYTKEPGRDLFADVTAVATGQADGAFTPFHVADDPEDPARYRIGHRLYVGHSLLGTPETKDSVVLRITPADPTRPWPNAVVWEAWDGTRWYQPTSAVTLVTVNQVAGWNVTLSNLAVLPPLTVGGVTSSWLRGVLPTALPAGELSLDPEGSGDLLLQRVGTPVAGFAANPVAESYQPIDFAAPFYPFGETWQLPFFYLALGQPLDKPASQVQIEIDVAVDQGAGGSGGFTPQVAMAPPQLPGSTLSPSFGWEYWNASGVWAPLPGASFQPGRAAGNGGVFLSSGTLRFAQPADWASGVVDGVSGFWLRARVTLVAMFSLVAGPAIQPPKVTRVVGGFSWLLPRVDLVTLALTLNRSDLLPELGFSNQLPLDLSKDFFPFGEKPRIGDAFYLSSEAVFARPGAKVTLTVKLTNPGNAPGPPLPALPNGVVLAWEFWDGQQWQPLAVTDTTGAFSVDNKTVSFDGPPTAPITVGGKTGHFLRVRIAAGNYGVEATYAPVWTGSPAVLSYQFTPASFRPPSIRSIRLGYSFTNPLAPNPPLPAEQLVTENDLVFEPQAAPAAGRLFTPFHPSRDDRPTLYLGFDRPGDTAGFANRSTALYMEVAPGLYDPAAEPQTVTEEAAVVWEYWNGSSWQRLGTRDETRGLSRRGLVTFLGPADFRASTKLGRLAFWLRARWERGDFPLPPQLARILLNTMWAVHSRTISGEVLGSGRGERSEVFQTRQTPVLTGQRLEVVEPELPSAGERAELEAEEGEDAVTVVPAAPGQPAEVRVRWHEVPDFYGSGPRSRHYVLDRPTGTVTFGDGQRGLPPPPGRGNVRMALYRAGGGLAGNRPAGNIAKLKGTVPYVKSVVQPQPAEGGADAESLDDVRERGPRALRHRDRVAAPVDFEDLALAASTAVARARCLPAHDAGDAGRVGLVVVRRSPLPKPVPDVELLNEVQDYVAARLSPVVDLWVVGPDWLQITVTTEIVPVTLEAATDVQNAVLDRLTAFLHPLTGGDGTGWDFGRQPYRSDLYALIESTPGVDHVSWLDVDFAADEGIARPERFLIYSGKHQITLTGSTDGGAA